MALWRARQIHLAYLGVFLLGAGLLSFAGNSPAAMLGAFALLAVAMFQITRLLLRPACRPTPSSSRSATTLQHDVTRATGRGEP